MSSKLYFVLAKGLEVYNRRTTISESNNIIINVFKADNIMRTSICMHDIIRCICNQLQDYYLWPFSRSIHQSVKGRQYSYSYRGFVQRLKYTLWLYSISSFIILYYYLVFTTNLNYYVTLIRMTRPAISGVQRFWLLLLRLTVIKFEKTLMINVRLIDVILIIRH